MNPMPFLTGKGNPHRTKHWWIRLGTKDSDTSHTVSANLAAAAHSLGDEVGGDRVGREARGQHGPG